MLRAADTIGVFQVESRANGDAAWFRPEKSTTSSSKSR